MNSMVFTIINEHSLSARKIGKKYLISHMSWTTSNGEIESGEWYGDDTMRLISIITMTFGKYNNEFLYCSSTEGEDYVFKKFYINSSI